MTSVGMDRALLGGRDNGGAGRIAALIGADALSAHLVRTEVGPRPVLLGGAGGEGRQRGQDQKFLHAVNVGSRSAACNPELSQEN